MDFSTAVNLILAVLSFILAVVSIITVVITLRQNSKMIEASTRPYVSICFHPLFNLDYLVLKNYGNSTAKIISIDTDVDFRICTADESHLPFSHASGTYLHPGERMLINYVRNMIFWYLILLMKHLVNFTKSILKLI